MDGRNWSDDSYLMSPNRRPSKRCCFCLPSISGLCRRLYSNLTSVCRKKHKTKPRNIRLARLPCESYPLNIVKNQKYNVFTFIPMVLFQQFKLFLNLYFLVMACSQFIPEIRIGYLSTYWGPLCFVISITMCREAFDDFCRYLRDKGVNSTKYAKLTRKGWVDTSGSKLQVGDIVNIKRDERVPADMLLLKTTEKSGACFIRTDQLDGETDWKLRVAVSDTQQLDKIEDVFGEEIWIYAEAPHKDIYNFIGTTKSVSNSGDDRTESLNVENTLWADTVVASGVATCLVIYTGKETRAALSTSYPHAKIGLLDLELNDLTKILCCVVLGLSFVMIVLKGFSGPWYQYLFRFVLLFSYIIPISLRVNLDMAKVVYSWLIGRDKAIPGTVVRSSTIPEELGRISYLLSDKTGTLTTNEMDRSHCTGSIVSRRRKSTSSNLSDQTKYKNVGRRRKLFRKLHLGTVSFSTDNFDAIKDQLRSAYATSSQSSSVGRQSVMSRVQQSVEAIALCHNVTPVFDSSGTQNSVATTEDTEADQQLQQSIDYQASSPDEVALVSWCESVGLPLVYRDLQTMRLRSPLGTDLTYSILHIFPFSSQSKRMGIVVKEEDSGQILFLVKGADVVMKDMVQYNDWLEEECSNMAREGLRTLVVAQKIITPQQFQEFEQQYHAARVSTTGRSAKMAAAVAKLEQDLKLLCLTGVEDKLQPDVKMTLETLRNAGIRVWMLTGDKQETASCIAKSSKLISRTQNVHLFKSVRDRTEAHSELNALRRKTDCALIITGDSLKICLEHYEEEFSELACGCSAVICCRCSPEQKTQIVKMLIKSLPKKRIAAVGDGGNDVGMIQASHAGIGIVGKEGQQASLAADFSITQFSHLSRLLLVHGRYCYKRSCSLGQFVMHRGLIISTMQAIFSVIFYFASVALYQGMLMVAYSTIYTVFPVFSLVMDRDISDKLALMYPELYKDLEKGRSLSYKTFFIWFLASVYEGAVIMYGALLLFENDFIHIVSITFTALIITELIMVGLTVHIWHWTMILAEIFSVSVYVLSLYLLDNFFDVKYARSFEFIWKTVSITLVSCLPLYIFKFLQKKFAPPSYAKLS